MFGREGKDIKTGCGRMFRGLGVEHRIAPSPQAKGKIERSLRKHVWFVIHDRQFWVVEEEPSPLATRWPKKLGHFRL